MAHPVFTVRLSYGSEKSTHPTQAEQVSAGRFASCQPIGGHAGRPGRSPRRPASPGSAAPLAGGAPCHTAVTWAHSD